MSTTDPSNDHVIGEGRFVRLHSRNGWEFIEQPGCSGIVVVLAVTDDGKLLLVEQYREPLKGSCIELPSGLWGDGPRHEGESLRAAAARELREETGYEAEDFDVMLRTTASPARASFFYTVLRARGLRKVGPPLGDGHESILLHEAPLASIDTWLRAREQEGRIIDAKVFAGLYLLSR